MNKRRVQKQAAFFIVLLFGLGLFELFNYHTSRVALDDIFTTFGAVLVGSWRVTLGSLLALAASTVDTFGILRIFTPEQGKHEPQWVRSAYTFWLIATVINTGLTWWVIRLGLINPRRIPPELVGHEVWIAVLLAIMVWAIRYGLVRNLGTTGDRFFHVTLPGPSSSINNSLPHLPKAAAPITFPWKPAEKKTPPPPAPAKKKWSKKDYQKHVARQPRIANLTNAQIAQMAGVDERTVYRWKKNNDT